jgi:hypothetical protein
MKLGKSEKWFCSWRDPQSRFFECIQMNSKTIKRKQFSRKNEVGTMHLEPT